MAVATATSIVWAAARKTTALGVRAVTGTIALRRVSVLAA